jgi:hypothetical protein
MPCYLVELDSSGAVALLAETATEHFLDLGVFWLHSYVADAINGGTQSALTVAVFESRGPEDLRKALRREGVTVHAITKVDVLHPHPYLGKAPR